MTNAMTDSNSRIFRKGDELTGIRRRNGALSIAFSKTLNQQEERFFKTGTRGDV